ncbi:MAG: hypothetical protein ACI9YH_001125 [Colwellia sp.]|jgi:uncharacterized protein (TIGR01244 family)
MIKEIKIFTTFLILITSFSGCTLENDIIGKISAKNVQQFTQQFIVGGQPSENDLVILSKRGIKTVINLRGDGEFNDFNEKAKVEALGMNYISIPIAGASGINNENLNLFSKAIENQEQAFIHCASGNRVGAMFALDAHFNHHKSLEEAITVGKKSGLTRLESTVRKVINNKKKKYEK